MFGHSELKVMAQEARASREQLGYLTTLAAELDTKDRAIDTALEIANAVISSIPMVAVIVMDAGGVFLFWNDVAKEYFGSPEAPDHRRWPLLLEAVPIGRALRGDVIVGARRFIGGAEYECCLRPLRVNTSGNKIVGALVTCRLNTCALCSPEGD